MAEVVLFKEQQRCPGWFRWLIGGSSIAFIAVLLAVLILSDIRDKNTFWLVFTLMIIAEGVFNLLLLTSRLTTLVTEKEVRVRLFPFQFAPKRIPLRDIERAYVRNYSPLMEYGGWGIRWSSNGRAYNMAGKIGMQLEMINDKKVIIGTQDAENFAKIMAQLGKLTLAN